MKSLYVLALICILGAVGLGTLALAHESATVGPVTMTVHFDNKPVVAGLPTALHILLVSTDASFRVEDCDCMLRIKHNDQELVAVALTPKTESEFNTEAIPVTFATEGEYDVTVVGIPKEGVTFAPFSVDRDIDVVASGTETHPHTHSEHLLHYMFLGAAILCCGIVIWRERKELFGKK